LYYEAHDTAGHIARNVERNVHGTSILKTENKGRQHNIKMYRAKKKIIMGTKLNSQTFETTVITS
jgi:hypothetical protein